MRQLATDIFSVLSSKEKRRFIQLAVFDIIISIADIAFLVLLLLIINFYTQPGAATGRLFHIRLFEDWPLLPVIIFFILFSIKNIAAFFISRKQSHFIYDTATRISADRLAVYLNGNFSDYIQTDSAVYAGSIGRQPLEFCNYMLKGLQQVISQAVLIVLTVIPIILYNAKLFPLLLLILLPPVILTGLIVKRKMNAIRLSIKKTSEYTVQYLKEALAGFTESNIYDRKDFFTRRYDFFRAKENRYQSDHQVVQQLPSRLIEVFAVFGLFVLVIIGTYNKAGSVLNIVTIGAFTAAAYKIIPGIVKLLNSIGQIKTYRFTVEGLADFLSENKQAAPETAGIHSLRFEDVSFSYGKAAVLKAISLNISIGELTGIAGVSGKGKSTLINVLLGFLEPSGGNIFINGDPTTATGRKKYWSRIAYAKQQPFLIHDTVLRNITLQEDGYDPEKLNDVLKISGVDDIISKHPDGIQTIVAEEGRNFSGGQRQRIIFARALYKDADILILDEPFSETDELTAMKLLLELKELTNKGKTVILITHSREGLSICDKKIILE